MLWPCVLLLHTMNMSAQLTSTNPNKILYTYVMSAFKRLNLLVFYDYHHLHEGHEGHEGHKPAKAKCAYFVMCAQTYVEDR